MGRVLGRKATADDVEPLNWTLGMLGRTFSASFFAEAILQWSRAARQMGTFFETYDLYLGPTIATPPLRI